MANKIRMGVVFGGRSGEHEVSIRSARAVIEAIDRERYEVVPIAITKEGHWLSPAEAVRMLPAETRPLLSEKVSRAEESIAILGDPSRQGLTALENNGQPREPQALDVVFPVLHGPFGEDGTIQGLLEMAGIPYIGSGVLGSSCGMDKVVMKTLFRQAELPVCKYTWFLRSEWERDRAGLVRGVGRVFGFPCFVKPANLGWSVGVSRAADRRTLEEAIDLAARFDRKLIIEEGLNAREIECGVIGNDDPQASLPGEYVVHDERARFLDYTEKYSDTGHVEFVVPASVPKRMAERIRRLAVQAFKAVDCAGLARVDFFLLRDSNELLLNELNTTPGLTDVSGFPKMWAASGMPFNKVLDRLVELAFERQREKLRNQTSP